MPELNIRQTTCKSALSPCGLPGFRYSLNPYRGCQHGCVYCYSPAVLRERREWGSFVDVKVNIPTVLSKELAKKQEGVVWFGSVCDAYQPVEERFRVSLRCLEQLRKVDWPVSMLTKSSLVVRDYELIASFSDFELGFSIAYASEELRGLLEPGASTIQDRLSAISKAADLGLDPWVFIAPIMPGFTDRPGELEKLIEGLNVAGVRRVGFDPFRPRPMIWPRMRALLESRPGLLDLYRGAARDSSYYSRVAEIIERETSKRGMVLVG